MSGKPKNISFIFFMKIFWAALNKCHEVNTQKSFTSEAQLNPFVLKFLLLAVHLLPQLYRVKYCQGPSKTFFSVKMQFVGEPNY